MSRLEKKIFITGKYLNVIKSYDKSRQCPFSNDLIQNYDKYLQNQDFSECVNKAFDWANQELMKIILVEKELLLRLKSMKQYFFLKAGDLFIHFLDTVFEEISKKPRMISQEKLQSLLEISIRTSSADNDKFKDDVTCYLTNYSTLEIMVAYTNPKFMTENIAIENFLSRSETFYSHSNNLKGYEVFTLDYEINWPLDIILPEKTKIKYQILFRSLFHFKYVEFILCSHWRKFQSLKDLNVHNYVKKSSALLQRMIHFIKNIIYNLCHEVIESKWKILVESLQNVTQFEDIISEHENFIDGCLRESLLLEPESTKLIARIQALCILYSSVFDENFRMDMNQLEFDEEMLVRV